MESSGADRGFFQQVPVLPNQALDDVSYRRCFRLFLPSDVASQVESEVATLGEDVLSDQVFAWVSDSERNKPFLKGSGRDAFGQWKGDLVTSEGWRKLQEFGIARGIDATGYDSPFGPFSRPLQFLRLHLWEGSCANVACPSAMQDGAARLLQLHLNTPKVASKHSRTELMVFQNAFDHLTSRDPRTGWTSGQWMTERSGGSDVSRTETTAIYEAGNGDEFASKSEGIPLGPWHINGFKWFSSATDSNMTILLARTPAGGLSAFLAPLRKHDPSATTASGHPAPEGECLNGVRIQRLKNKFGTQGLPTAELVLEDMRGWLIGQEGRGIQEIGTVLTLTRIHSAVGSVGYVGRGLGIARAYAKVREVGAGRGARMGLTDSSLHMNTLAGMTTEYHGLMLLTFFNTYVLGLSEHPETSTAHVSPALSALTPEKHHLAPLLRVAPQLAKAYVCKSAMSTMFSCVESLGGVGYLLNEEQESLNVARLYRDCAVLPIWEGTTDVLSTDFIRALKHPKSGDQSFEALGSFMKKASAFQGQVSRPNGWDPCRSWESVRARIASESQENLMGSARELLWTVAEIMVSVLLYVDAASDGDSAAEDMFYRFVQSKFSVERQAVLSPAQQLDKDRAIVYGRAKLGAASKL